MLPHHGARRHPGKSKGRSAFGIGVCLCVTLFIAAIGWELSMLIASSEPKLDNKELAKIEERLRAEILQSNKDKELALEEHLLSEKAEKEYVATIGDLKERLSLSEAMVENLKIISDSNKETGDETTDADIKNELASSQALALIKTNEVIEVKGEAERLSREVEELRSHLKQSETKVNEMMAAASSSSVVAISSQGGSSGKWYDKPGYGRLLSPYEWKRPLPPLIDAWRNGKLDWHDLIPKHSSLWERYGESQDDKFNFMKLVMKEVAVTDYLTQYQDSGLASNYNRDFGPMRNYSSCNLVDDPCMIHGQEECTLNSFCKWNADTTSCATVSEKDAPRGCETGSPKKLVGSRFQSVDERSCKRFINERVFVEHVADDPAAMFYHWWRYFKEVYARVQNGGGSDKLSHFLLDRPSNTQFFHYFGLLSKFCWRRTSSLPEGTCFCEAPKSRREEPSGSNDVLGHLLKELNLGGSEQAPRRVMVGILSRRRKRFILNEHELVETVLSMGYDVQVLPMEEMTLYEQIKALRSCTVLVGIHGSGLNNAILLPKDAVLVQLLPYKLNYKGAFQQVAHENGVSYIEWGLDDPNKSYFHWEFLGTRELANGKQAVLDRGSPKGGAEVYTFWINQDIIIPVDEFRAVIERAVKHTGQLNPTLSKKQMGE